MPPIVDQQIVERQLGRARIAEHIAHAAAGEQFDKGLNPSHASGRTAADLAAVDLEAVGSIALPLVPRTRPG